MKGTIVWWWLYHQLLTSGPVDGQVCCSFSRRKSDGSRSQSSSSLFCQGWRHDWEKEIQVTVEPVTCVFPPKKLEEFVLFPGKKSLRAWGFQYLKGKEQAGETEKKKKEKKKEGG